MLQAVLKTARRLEGTDYRSVQESRRLPACLTFHDRKGDPMEESIARAGARVAWAAGRHRLRWDILQLAPESQFTRRARLSFAAAASSAATAACTALGGLPAGIMFSTNRVGMQKRTCKSVRACRPQRQRARRRRRPALRRRAAGGRAPRGPPASRRHPPARPAAHWRPGSKGMSVMYHVCGCFRDVSGFWILRRQPRGIPAAPPAARRSPANGSFCT